MKSCRCGFIRCSTRDEPWGSHHVDARALKWDISEALTDGESEGFVCGGAGFDEGCELAEDDEEWEEVVVLWYRLAAEGMRDA